MRFLIDRCAGRRLAEFLRKQGHDAVETRERGSDPGDRKLLEWAAAEQRILITLDKDFGSFLFLERVAHAGLVRLPDVPALERIRLVGTLLANHLEDLSRGAVVTVRGGRIRISLQPERTTNER